MALSNFDLMRRHFKTGVPKTVGFTLKPFHAHAREVSNERGFLLRDFFANRFKHPLWDIGWFRWRGSCLGNRRDISPKATREIVASHAHRDRLERLK